MVTGTVLSPHEPALVACEDAFDVDCFLDPCNHFFGAEAPQLIWRKSSGGREAIVACDFADLFVVPTGADVA